MWRNFQDRLAGFPRPVEVLELRGGLSTGSLALQELLGRPLVSTVGYWDLGPLEALLRPSFQSEFDAGLFHVDAAGDILRLAPEEFPLADVIVTGPPCPPFSSIGKRGAWEDERSRPMLHCLRVIASQARAGKLIFAALENVAGFATKIRSTGEVPTVEVEGKFKELLGPMGKDWQTEIRQYNTLDFGIPQSRPRVFMLFRRLAFYPRLPRPVANFAKRLPLGHFLEGPVDDLFGTGGSGYTPVQKQNLRDFKDLYKAELQNASLKGKYAIFDVTRTPAPRTQWGAATKRVDVCPCLTATGERYHVLALGFGDPAAPLDRFALEAGTLRSTIPVDRTLLSEERGRLQGFPEHICQITTGAVKAFGNAISLPVMGAVLARELMALYHHGSAALPKCTAPAVPEFHHLLAAFSTGSPAAGPAQLEAEAEDLDTLAEPAAASSSGLQALPSPLPPATSQGAPSGAASPRAAAAEAPRSTGTPSMWAPPLEPVAAEQAADRSEPTPAPPEGRAAEGAEGTRAAEPTGAASALTTGGTGEAPAEEEEPIVFVGNLRERGRAPTGAKATKRAKTSRSSR